MNKISHITCPLITAWDVKLAWVVYQFLRYAFFPLSFLLPEQIFQKFNVFKGFVCLFVCGFLFLFCFVCFAFFVCLVLLFLSFPLTHGKKLVYRKGRELLFLGKCLVNSDFAFLHFWNCREELMMGRMEQESPPSHGSASTIYIV